VAGRPHTRGAGDRRQTTSGSQQQAAGRQAAGGQWSGLFAGAVSFLERSLQVKVGKSPSDRRSQPHIFQFQQHDVATRGATRCSGRGAPPICACAGTLLDLVARTRLHRVAPEAHAGAPPAPARAALPGRAMPTPEWPMWHEGFIEQVEGESTKRVWVSVGLNSTLCVGPEKGAEPLSGKVYTIPPAGYKLACHARTRASAPVCG
jgi:hypothetical protein